MADSVSLSLVCIQVAATNMLCFCQAQASHILLLLLLLLIFCTRASDAYDQDCRYPTLGTATFVKLLLLATNACGEILASCRRVQAFRS